MFITLSGCFSLMWRFRISDLMKVLSQWRHSFGPISASIFACQCEYFRSFPLAPLPIINLSYSDSSLFNARHFYRSTHSLYSHSCTRNSLFGYFSTSTQISGKSTFIEATFPRSPFRLSRALPRADGEVSGEEHVHEVLELVGDLEAEALAHHHVPGWSKPIDEDIWFLHFISWYHIFFINS